MTYHENIVVVVKVNGQVLRESGDTVTIPFGAEYSILIKNLNSRRIQTKVSVDGQIATEGANLVIDANSSIELERWIKNGNLAGGNRFKFIERTGVIESHRGVGAEDGLIRVETWRELVQPVINAPIVVHYPATEPYPWDRHPWRRDTFTYGDRTSVGSLHGPRTKTARSGSGIRGQSMTSAFLNQAQNTSTPTEDSLLNDHGITVPGSESAQQFYSVQGFALESQSQVIVLKLRGQIGRLKVARAVTVKTKPKCVTCGRTNKGGTKFCAECGTALMVI